MNLKDVTDVLYGFELIGEISEIPKTEKDDEEQQQQQQVTDEPVEEEEEGGEKIIYLHVLHRKVEKERLFFISPYTTQLFSVPFVVSFDKSRTTGKDLYSLLHTKVKFMMEQLEKQQNSETNGAGGVTEVTEQNEEKDEGGEEVQFPFLIRVVNQSGEKCPDAPWYHFNIGTEIDPNSENLLNLACGTTIALDWFPSVYHLKYYRENSKWYQEHESVKANWDLLNAPIMLDQCK